MTEYVLACTEYIHHINASSNLGVEGMESPLGQIKHRGASLSKLWVFVYSVCSSLLMVNFFAVF